MPYTRNPKPYTIRPKPYLAAYEASVASIVHVQNRRVAIGVDACHTSNVLLNVSPASNAHVTQRLIPLMVHAQLGGGAAGEQHNTLATP